MSQDIFSQQDVARLVAALVAVRKCSGQFRNAVRTCIGDFKSETTDSVARIVYKCADAIDVPLSAVADLLPADWREVQP